MSLRREAPLLACALLLACSGERPAPAGPGAPVTDPAAPPPPIVAPTPPPPAPNDPAGLVGWWRGDEVCLELFANGDFELSSMHAEPKRMAMGAATITPTGDGFELKLATARIWKARFTGPCRKVHEYGDWTDSHGFLGVPFKPGETVTLKLRRLGDDKVELCSERCTTLTRSTPHLGARWRRASLPYPDRADPPIEPGDLLELKLDQGNLAHLWAGLPDRKHATVYGKSSVEYVSPDRFNVTFTAEWFADLPEGVTPEALGYTFATGDRRSFTARRLAGERLEVCAGERCVTLERQFDGSNHDLD
jgi:hypothetical protein